MSAGYMETPGDPGTGASPGSSSGAALERRGGAVLCVSVAGAQEGAAAWRIRIPALPSH
jgi:hypothetical protein